MEKRVVGIIAILGLVLAIFFFSANITGFAIANLSQTNSTWIGVVLLVIALIIVWFYFRKTQ